jgi:hypothetical protein
LGGAELPAGGTTTLVYEGCDPGSGEVTHNQFVVSTDLVSKLATEFFLHERMLASVAWLEL